jgi:reversibly glycosylated polypeptide/UDP-arabinopyranose mutase
MKKVALVVPSIREESFNRFIREWTPTGLFQRVDLILIEDNPTRTFQMDLEGGDHMHLCWEDIDREKWAHIIPRRSDTVRSFGYWWAWAARYKFLMTLDDDCYPERGYEELDKMHLQFMDRTRWFNTLNNVRPRGTPYKNLGYRPVHINHGLWTNVLDYDAPQQLVNPVEEVFTHDNRIVPHRAYHSFCGMNAMWRREAMVLSYHMLMGKQRSQEGGDLVVLEQLPFDRFGDIWCGIIQKKICDHLGWSVSSGTPYIHHDRASNPFTNLRKEANGIEVNEWFWEKIDSIPLMGIDPRMLYKLVANFVANFGGEHDEYWQSLGKAMSTWADLFTEL